MSDDSDAGEHLPEDDGGEYLPENDSVFADISSNPIDTSTESILDDSFSSIISSTPAAKGKSSRKGHKNSPTRRLQGRTLPQTSSPGPSTRSQSRDTSPLTCRSPGRQSTRCATPQPTSSPRPTTRSQTRAASPQPSSPSSALRRSTRSVTPQLASSPRPATRSQTRAASPLPACPGPAPRPLTRSGSPAPHTRTTVTPLPQRQPAAAPRFPTKLKCPLCPALLANETTLAAHKKRHALKRAFTRAATREEFIEAQPALIKQALDKIQEEPCIGSISEEVNNFAQTVHSTFNNLDEEHQRLFDFLGDHFYDILSNHSSIFSSTLQYTFLVGVNKLLNSSEFRNNLRSLILGLDIASPPSSVEVLNVFVSNFVMQLSYCVIIYYVKKIHGFTATQEVRKKRSNDSLDSTDFLQLSYHIGGSIVSGYLYKGQKYKSSSWKSFVSVLRYKFLRVQAVGNACADEVREFTESKDRGGLKHISQEALDFFVVIFDLLMSLEGADGSLPQNVVDDYVLKDDVILCLWDTLVGSELEEDVSVDFLERVANTCKMVVMKGIMKRKLNNYLKKAVSALPLRSRLA